MGGRTEGGGEGPLGAVETPPSPSHRPACHPHLAAEAVSGRHGTRLQMRLQMRSLCVHSAGRNPGTGHLLLCRVIWGGEAGEQLGQELGPSFAGRSGGAGLREKSVDSQRLRLFLFPSCQPFAGRQRFPRNALQETSLLLTQPSTKREL